MTLVSTEDVQKNVDSLLLRVKQGEAFLIALDGKPLGTLEPVNETEASTSQQQGRRVFGSLEGRLTIPDDFDEMMRGEIVELFYGKS